MLIGVGVVVFVFDCCFCCRFLLIILRLKAQKPTKASKSKSTNSVPIIKSPHLLDCCVCGGIFVDDCFLLLLFVVD
jgi:hypothetical protein